MNYLAKKFFKFVALHIDNTMVQAAAAGCYGIFEIFGFVRGTKILTQLFKLNMEQLKNARTSTQKEKS